MAKRPKSKIQRGFVLGYLAVAVMVIATGFALRNFPSISADTATTDATTLQKLHYTASVDGNATIQFSGTTAKVTSSDYKGVTGAATTGDLTGCSTVALSGDTTGRVGLTSATNPFTVKIRDNGSGTPPPYSFDLVCTDPIPVPSASPIVLNRLHYTATVDGNATIKFAGKVATVVSADYKGVTGATVTGDLTGCKTVALSGDTTGRVSLTSAVSPFTVKIKDNGTGTPPPYSFDLTCIDDIPTPTPIASLSPSPEASTTTTPDVYTVTLKHGFNTIIVPSDDATAETADTLALDTSPITDNGMFVYDFNRLGQKNWRTTNPAAGALFGNIDRMVSNIGYYVYNPGNSQTLSLPFISTGQTVTNEEKIKIRRGWNLIASASSKGRSLSTDYGINVLQPDASNDCVADDCFAYVSLRDLFAGDASTNRAYGTIYEIKDGTATTADAAFTVVKINSTNIDTITIPPKTPFWIYLWN